MPERNSLRVIIKEYLNSSKEILLSSTSLQFLVNPIRTKRLLIKLLNIFFILLYMIFSIYLVVSNIIDYLNFETVTSIKTIVEPYSEFPTVTICSNDEVISLDPPKKIWFNNEDLILENWTNHFDFYNEEKKLGDCFRFNSGFTNITNNSKIPIKKSLRGGEINGLWIDILSFKVSSIYISIQNHTFLSKTIFNRGYYVFSDTNIVFNIKRIYDQKLEYPYNDCFRNIFDFNLNKTLIQFFKTKNLQYSQKECFLMCLNLKYIEISGCNCTVDLDDDLYSKCYDYNSDDNQKCYMKFMKFLNENYKSCFDYCPLECESMRFEILVSSNWAKYDNYNTFNIHVFYDELKYTWISQKPKIEFIALISNIGGSLGLFLGTSFISCLELFEILVEFFYISLNK
jgi:hypothetical protein